MIIENSTILFLLLYEFASYKSIIGPKFSSYKEIFLEFPISDFDISFLYPF
jgi:hypothetical protein